MVALVSKAVKISIAATGFHDSKEEMIRWIDGGKWKGLGERILKGGDKGLELVFAGGLVSKKFNEGKNGSKVEGRKAIRELA